MSLLAFLGGAVNELGNQFHEERTRTRKAEDDEIERRRGYLESLYNKMLEDPTLSSRHPEYYGQALKDIMTLSQAQGQPRKPKAGKEGFFGGTDTAGILVPFLQKALSGELPLMGGGPGGAPGGAPSAGAPTPNFALNAPPGGAPPAPAPPPASMPTAGSTPRASFLAPPPQAAGPTGLPAPMPVDFSAGQNAAPAEPVHPPLADPAELGSIRRGGTPPPARFNGLDLSQVRTGPPALAPLPGPVAPMLPPPPGTNDNYLLTSPGEKQRLTLEAQLRAGHAVRAAEFNDKVDELVRAGTPRDEAMQVAAGLPLASWVKSDNDPVKDPKSPTGYSTVVYNAKDPSKWLMVPASAPGTKTEDKLPAEMQTAFLRVTGKPIVTQADLVRFFPDARVRNQAIDAANTLMKNNRGSNEKGTTPAEQARLNLASAGLAANLAANYRQATQGSTVAIQYAEQAKKIMGDYLRTQGNKSGGSRIILDQVLINAVNKIIDPNSVVRQSEYARTPEGQGYLAQIQGAWEHIGKGGSGLSLDELKTVYEATQSLVEGHKRHTYGEAERTIAAGLMGGITPDQGILSREDLMNTYDFMAKGRLTGSKPGATWSTPDGFYTYFVNSQGVVMRKGQ